MIELWPYYYWLSFTITFVSCLKLPTTMNGLDNFMGSWIVSMFGFVVWPFALFALIKTKKE